MNSFGTEFWISWGPMLLLIVVWLIIYWRMRGGTEYQKDRMEMWRRQVAALERIATILEKNKL